MTLPDGFVFISPHELSDLALNVNFTVDEFSPFVNPRPIVTNSNELIVDQYYGQAYHLGELLPAAIYGRTVDLPFYSGDQLANDGFLRVPFRRIPRRVVHNRAEIEDLIASIRSADDSLRIMFRGQNHEYLVKRSSPTTRWLYGDESVLEPSLMTSASRRRPSLEDVFPEWSALLRIFAGETADAKNASAINEFANSEHLPLSALALAQHYGLPTSGLDLTDRIDVALFFALMKYEKAPKTICATYSRLGSGSEKPVVYILCPAKQQQFDFESYRSRGFPRGRPDAQSARFMHVGWGYNTNACAARVFLALYLDPAGDFDPIPSPHELFPTGEEDRLAEYVARLSIEKLPGTLARVLAEGFYVIAELH